MDIKTYLLNLTPDKRIDFAKACRVSSGHLRNVAYGDRPISTRLAVAIERQTESLFTVEGIFPAVAWVRIKDKKWPNPAGRPLLDVAQAVV